MNLKVYLKKYILGNYPIIDILIFIGVIYLKMTLFFNGISLQNNYLSLTLTGKLSNIIILILISLPFYFISNRKRKTLFLGFSLVISTIMLFDLVYYRYFNDIASLTLIYQLNQTGDVFTDIFKLFKATDVLFIVDLFIAIPLFITNIKVINKEKQKIYVINMIAMILILISFALTNVFFILNTKDSFETRNASRIYACQFGILTYHQMDFYYFVKNIVIKPKFSSKELLSIKQDFLKSHLGTKEALFGALKGKNILMIQEESLGSFVKDLIVDGQEITPNLNKLAKSSYYNSNAYNEVAGGHTSDVELMSLTSLYPIQNESVSIMYASNDYVSIPNILNEDGYRTISSHSYRGDFWNRINMHKSLGFKTSYFELELNNIDAKVGWGMPDGELFKQTIAKITSSTDKRPFFSYIITLQNHLPFKIPQTEKVLKLGKLEGTDIGNYLHSVHSADKEIGILISALKEKGLYENTAIILYGDHDAEFTKEQYKPLIDMENDYDILKYERVPFLIHFPETIQPKIDTNVMGDKDIATSLLYLLGIDYKYPYFYGNNIFTNSDGQAVIQDFHFITNDYIFVNLADSFELGKVIDAKTLKEVKKTQEMKDRYIKLKTQMDISKKLIMSNSIKKLKEIN